MVAIGTIADMVSLTGENRALVQMGLNVVRSGERIGLDMLLEVLELSKEEVKSSDIGFKIAPTLNAIGRLGDPNPGVELMAEFDEERAILLSREAVGLNDERKCLTKTVVEEMDRMLEGKNDQDAYVFLGKDWHQGVLGLAAGQLMNRIGKPVVVLTEVEGGFAKGSARSVEAVNLFEILDKHRTLFKAVGGHHAAAGMTISIDHVAELEQILLKEIQSLNVDLTKGVPLKVDGILKIEEASLSLVEELEKIEPFGMDFPEPTFLFQNVGVMNPQAIGVEGLHLKGMLTDETGTLNSIYFRNGKYVGELSREQNQSFVGKLGKNVWNGQKTVQLMIEDFSIEGVQMFDYRGEAMQRALPFEKGLFLTFHPSNRENPLKLKAKYVMDADETIFDFIKNHGIEEIVFVDVPDDFELGRKLKKEYGITRFYVMAQTPLEEYLLGVGSREQFAKLYQVILKKEEINIRKKYKEVAKYLGVDARLLIYMIQVFEELGFIQIKDGILTKEDNPQKCKIEDSQIFQKRKRLIEMQELFVLGNMQEIKASLEMETTR
jgi:single-stranded-DNA-specific exonuclease